MSLLNFGKPDPTYFTFADQLNLAPDAEYNLVPVEATDPQEALWFAIEYFAFGKEISIGDNVLIIELDSQGDTYGPFFMTGEKFSVKETFFHEVSAESLAATKIDNDEEKGRTFYYKLGWKNNPYHSLYSNDIFKLIPLKYRSTYLNASAYALAVIGERPESRLINQKYANATVTEELRQLSLHKKILILSAALLCVSIVMKWSIAAFLVFLVSLATIGHLFYLYIRNLINIKKVDLRESALRLQEDR